MMNGHGLKQQGRGKRILPLLVLLIRASTRTGQIPDSDLNKIRVCNEVHMATGKSTPNS